MPTIALENVTKYYQTGKHGSSGAGKSTLLDVISGQMRPDRGVVRLEGRDLSKLMRWNYTRTAMLFGKVPQEQSLIRKMTVEENLMLAARVGRKLESARQLQARIEKVVGLVGMAGTGKRYPAEMSIGECRRVELARALINSPPILILDEITANLDDDNIWDIFHLLTEINHRGTTVIMATHASKYVNIMRRRVVTLVDGRLFGDVRKGRYGDVV